jgi:hypothetical protein
LTDLSSKAQGAIMAQSDFGAYDARIIYGDAKLQEKDYKAAFAAYLDAASAGLAAGQHNVAHLYQEGLGTAVDHAEALKWFRKAAEQGAPASQVGLGLMLYHGQGVAVDYQAALKWIRLAADQGDARGEYVLGTIYESGKAVQRDLQQAVVWFDRAAQHGSREALTARARVVDRQKYERDRQTVLDEARRAGATVMVSGAPVAGVATPAKTPRSKTPSDGGSIQTSTTRTRSSILGRFGGGLVGAIAFASPWAVVAAMLYWSKPWWLNPLDSARLAWIMLAILGIGFLIAQPIISLRARGLAAAPSLLGRLSAGLFAMNMTYIPLAALDLGWLSVGSFSVPWVVLAMVLAFVLSQPLLSAYARRCRS